jgi:hypothetical protein
VAPRQYGNLSQLRSYLSCWLFLRKFVVTCILLRLSVRTPPLMFMKMRFSVRVCIIQSHQTLIFWVHRTPERKILALKTNITVYVTNGQNAITFEPVYRLNSDRDSGELCIMKLHKSNFTRFEVCEIYDAGSRHL